MTQSSLKTRCLIRRLQINLKTIKHIPQCYQSWCDDSLHLHVMSYQDLPVIMGNGRSVLSEHLHTVPALQVCSSAPSQEHRSTCMASSSLKLLWTAETSLYATVQSRDEARQVQAPGKFHCNASHSLLNPHLFGSRMFRSCSAYTF